MENNVIIYVVLGFLVIITLIRREMLKPEPKTVDRRKLTRRKSKKIRRSSKGRRTHDFNEDCEDEDRRKKEDRRTGQIERRHRERRHS